MTEQLGIVIAGAGVIGAAVAHALRDHPLDIVVLECEARPGTGISSRNSGVIHAGLYYPPGSAKERFCREGARLLYDFAARKGIPHRRTGKFIVANDAREEAYLDWLRAKNAGAVTLEPVAELPPGIRARAALFSPNSGIVDVHLLIETLLAESGATVLTHQRVTEMQSTEDHAVLTIAGESFRAGWLINCTGLSATDFREDESHVFAKGTYFRIKIPEDLEIPHLVYPAVPKNSPGLGIHLTRNLAGEAYLGPDLEWTEQPTLFVDSERASLFFDAARRYLPWLDYADLEPGYAGIRPKLAREGWRDFLLEREGRLIHCLGIESPGITAAMAIGEEIASWISPRVERSLH